MKCPNCLTESLQPKLTRRGVEVDRCSTCGGIWMDEGEIFYFTNRPKELAQALERGMQHAHPSKRLSPKTNQPMQQIPLLGEDLFIEVCPTTRGLWLDGGELDHILSVDPKFLAIKFDEPQEISPDELQKMRLKSIARGGLPLPNLVLRSTMTLVILYGILGLALITLVEFAGVPPEAALGGGVVVVLVQFLLAPFFTDLLLRWFYSMRWVRPEQLPDHLRNFVQRVCQEKRMRFPRFGLIYDGAPNAFTYGHTPSNARIVITKGIFDLLDETEVEAVVAHEIGHAKHWDMLLMTVAQLVPLVLYYLYKALMDIVKKISEKRGSKDKGNATLYLFIAALGAYILYIISVYIVLWFSRTREYYADWFSGQVTGKPNELASALVKIAYGLAGQAKKEEKEARVGTLEAADALGIFDPGMARAFAVSSYSGYSGSVMAEGSQEKGFDRTALLRSMSWDLWTPWAKFFELHSTHPLIAKRLRYLSEQAVAMGQEPFVLFNLRKPESYWDEFFVDVTIMWLPSLALIALVPTVIFTGEPWLFGGALGTVMGIFMLLKLWFSYPRQIFPPMTVSSLLKKVKVSPVRSVPCTLKGRVIGRGVPGLIWSEDFVMRDDTGIIFLDYRQPLRIWEFLFGLLRRQQLQDAPVEVTGWYRRSPAPYIELNTLKTLDDGKTRRCYVYYVSLIFACLMIAGGVAVTVLLGGVPAYERAGSEFLKNLTVTFDEEGGIAITTKKREWREEARYLYQHNKYLEALQVYNKILEIEPDNYDVLYWKGRALQKLDRHEEAVTVFNKVLELATPKFDHYYNAESNKAYSLYKLGMYEEALGCVDTVLRSSPEGCKARKEAEDISKRILRKWLPEVMP